jgi:peptidoglycan-associated lipoprotein
VENMAFFNTKYDDFSPAYAKKDYKVVYFSSTRPGAHGDKINIITGQPFTDIFGATKDRKGTWSVPTPLNVEVNSEFDEGASSLNEKANTLYFTRCRYSKSEALGCQVLWAKKRGVGWGEATVIPLAHDSVSVGHPSISKDELTLYFTANIPGGQGGNDIWMIKRVKRTAPWSSDAINLGPEINTPGNEMFPFIHKDGSLYFSSDRHLGMGGLDIFKATKEGDKWSISNIKYPLNTPSDDFGIIFQGTQERGFLTSNRRGGKGGDDIYTFVLPPLEFTLAGIVKDEKSNRYMPGAKVKLIEEGGTIIEATSEADGSFKFKLKPNKNYQISTEMENYLKGRANVSTKNLEDDSEDIQLEVFMKPIEKTFELPHIEYDVAKWDLRPESMVSLNELIKTMDDNSNITIELMSHTDFRPPSGITNKVLSQNRAQSVVDYLIEKGVPAERLTPVGYGATKPKVVDSVTASVNTFLKEGDVLDKPYILKRSTKTEREVCHQLNRRTEFRVLKQNYQPKTDFNTPGGATEGTKPNVQGVKPE